MNIGIDIRCLMDKQRTGVGEYTCGFLNALFSCDNADKNQYFLFYNSYQDVSQNIPKWEQANVRYVYIRWPNKLLNLLVWLKIVKLDKKILKNIKYLDTFFSPNLNFIHLSKHVKHIQTIHDLSFEFFPECFTWKQRLWHKFLNPQKQCQRADVILTPSENTKRDVANRYQIPDSKIQVLRPGLSSDYRLQTIDYRQKMREKYNLPEKYILYLGTLEPRKNVESIIEAYKMNYESGIRNYGLVISGWSGWKNKKLLQLISKTSEVKYIGYVDEVDKPALYQGASLFVFPSLYEGFGLPVLEAIASGVPVITSNRSSLPEVAGDAGYLVDPHNLAEIAEAMELILANKDLSALLINRGKERAKKFDLPEAGNFGKIITGLIKT